jgi:hypothetical protein
MGKASLGKGACFESKHAFADRAQGFPFLPQEFPGFLVADFSLAKLLDHIPQLGAVLVGPFMKCVRRTWEYLPWLHWRDFPVGFSSNYYRPGGDRIKPKRRI